MQISEEELNSEVELLGDQDILRQVVIERGLAAKISWISFSVGPCGAAAPVDSRNARSPATSRLIFSRIISRKNSLTLP